MESSVVLMRLMYAANVLVAGWVGFSSLFAPSLAVSTVFQGTASSEDASLRITGALWSAIALLSFAGLFAPYQFSAILLLQLLYKGGWLLVVYLPVLFSQAEKPMPSGMAAFFILWVVLLPFVIPFRYLFGSL